MAFLDQITTGAQARPIRGLVYGVEKVGKSTVLAGAPAPLFIAGEDGTNHLDVARFVPVRTNIQDPGLCAFDQIITVMDELYRSPSPAYQTIVFDPIDWIEELAIEKICREHEVGAINEIAYGKGKQHLRGAIRDLVGWMQVLYTRGYNVWIVGHATVKNFANPEGEDYDRYSVKATFPETAEAFKEWVDVMIFMNYDLHFREVQKGMAKANIAESNNTRMMYLERTVAFDAGNRYGMPRAIALSSMPHQNYVKFDTEYQKYAASLQKPETTNTAPAA